jgi:SNF2 family DNA or RNA helicase
MFINNVDSGIEISHVGNGKFLVKGIPFKDLQKIEGLFDISGATAIVEWWYLSEFMQSLKVLGYEEATVDKQETQDFIQTIRGKEEALRLLLDREKECTIPEIPEFKEKLFEIQKRGVLGLLNRRVFGLFDEMGAGKTIQAIYAFALLQKFMKRNCRMLIVCPKNVKYDWRNAFDQYLGMPVDFAEDNLKGQIVVAHFEQVIDRTIKKVVNYVETKQVIESKVFDSLKKEVFDIIVVDEGHYVKNQKSKRTRVVRELLPPRKNTEIDHVCGKIDSMNVTLSRTRPYVWFLTGTPMENSEDIYVFLKES